jgi:hypothetical protein
MKRPGTAKIPGSAQDLPSPALKNPAVARCCDAWESAFQAESKKCGNQYGARSEANTAYRKAMPPLSGHQGVSDFIACVTYGMLIEAIRNEDASKLLYAAQVALSSTRSQPQKQRSRA